MFRIFEHLTIWVLVQHPYFHDPSTSRPPSQVPQSNSNFKWKRNHLKAHRLTHGWVTFTYKIHEIVLVSNGRNQRTRSPYRFVQHENKSIRVIGASERTEETSMSNSVRRKDIFNNHGLCWGRGGGPMRYFEEESSIHVFFGHEW